MTLLPQAGEGAALAHRADDPFHDALRLFAAVADVLAGDAAGTSARAARIAAAFARRRGASKPSADAVFIAGLLHRTGVIENGSGDPAETVMRAVALARSLDGVPAASCDIVRWHAERFDGTGVPDGLRWNAIPEAAAILGLARRFVDARRAAGGELQEAAYALLSRSGRDVDPVLGDAFHSFATTLDDGALVRDPAPDASSAPAAGEAAHALHRLAAAIDERTGTGGRTDALVAAVEARCRERGLDGAALERARALARLWRLRSLPLDGVLAATLVAECGSLAAYAPALDGSADDPAAEIVASANAALV